MEVNRCIEFEGASIVGVVNNLDVGDWLSLYCGIVQRGDGVFGGL